MVEPQGGIGRSRRIGSVQGGYADFGLSPARSRYVPLRVTPNWGSPPAVQFRESYRDVEGRSQKRPLVSNDTRNWTGGDIENRTTWIRE